MRRVSPNLSGVLARMADPAPSSAPQDPPRTPASEAPPPAAVSPASAPSSGPLGTSPAPATDAPPIFRGSVSHWMAVKSYTACVIVELAGLAALIYGSIHAATGIGMTAMVGGFALMAVAALMALYIFLRIRTTRYTITYRLIERETGLFIKKVDALDIGRVKHVDMTQSLVERMFNVGTIEVYSGDSEEALLLIEDIPNARGVYERLRDAVIDLSRRRGVIIE